MKKCIICNKDKGKRFCAAINSNICPLCCGSQRQKEITCFPECEYLKKGKEYQFARRISQEINSSFKTEADDIFKNNNEAVEFAFPLEKFFVKKFYYDSGIYDSDIYNALVKIYLYQTKSTESLLASNKCEELIFGKFNEVNKKFANISEDTKTKTILRILKSIKTSSGGALGNKNYLEMIYSQFNKDGQWSYLFDIDE